MEEYESTKSPPSRAGITGELSHASPKTGGPPPIAWSLAGTANSPSSNLTLIYQNWNANMMPPAQQQALPGVSQASTPPGNMVYDPIRQSLPTEPVAMYPPVIPQANTSAARHSPRIAKLRRLSSMGGWHLTGQLASGYDGMPDEADGPKLFGPPGYTPSGQHPGGGFEAYNASPVGKMPDAQAAGRSVGNANGPGNVPQSVFYGQGAPYPAPWGVGMGNMDAITFDSQDIDIGALGLQQQALMSGWLDYLPNDVLSIFENHEMSHATQGNPRSHS